MNGHSTADYNEDLLPPEFRSNQAIPKLSQEERLQQ